MIPLQVSVQPRPTPIIPYFVHIQAFIVLGLWIFTHMWSGLISSVASEVVSMGEIAWWAKFGSFFVGL